MSNIIASVDNYNVPTVAAVFYTVPNNTQGVIQKATVTSREAANTQLFTLYKVAPAGMPGTGNIIVYQKAIPPCTGGTGIIDVPELVNQVLEPGYTLQAIMDAGADFYLNMAILEVN